MTSTSYQVGYALDVLIRDAQTRLSDAETLGDFKTAARLHERCVALVDAAAVLRATAPTVAASALLEQQPYPPYAPPVTPRHAGMGRCGADARKGTGSGICDQPLDVHGNCDRASNHVQVGA